MRIAYLTQSYPPMISGAAIFAGKTAESMAQRGHKVLVVAASDREFAYHTYKENMIVLRLRSFNNPLRVGQRLIAYPYFRVKKALKQFKPDIIHAHEPFQMGAIALQYAKRTNVPVTITVHQLPWFVASYLPKALKVNVEKTLWLYARLSLRRYTAVITPTPTISALIEQMTGVKSSVISIGLDISTFHPPPSLNDGTAPRSRLNLPMDVPIILHVGRLDADKSVDQVIRGTAPAIRETEAHLLIVGDGKQKHNLIRLCKSLGIEKRVHFTGYILQNELPDVYRMANLFVTASKIETQGIVLLEAAASGLPIVAMDATCIPEIVHNQVNGILVRPGDIEAFGNAIVSLLNDTERAFTMGEKGCILAGKHEIQHSWTSHENLYIDMIKHANEQSATIKNDDRFLQWKFVKELLGLK